MLDIIKEHKFTLISLAVWGLVFAKWLFFPSVKLVAINNPFEFLSLVVVMMGVMVSLALSVLIEMPRSRLAVLRVFGNLAWGALFLGALLTGWKMWI